MISRLAARPLTRPLVRNASSDASAFVRRLLPDIKGLSLDSTLGEVADRAYGKYRFRLVYPLAAYVGVMYYFLWIPYTPQAEKDKIVAHSKHLESLEFRQVP